jgi:RimJ/RimL family protein N-acetyltransferase
MAPSHAGHVVTRLRPVRPDEADLLERWREDVQTEFEEWGEPPSGHAADAVVPKPTGPGELMVTDGHDLPLGRVSWHQVLHGPSVGSIALDIGIMLRPEARGHGHGSRAQRMLAEYLFRTFPVHRLQASTDVANVAEQRALERAGFVREGILRGAQWRRGEWRDLMLYARLRTDA